MDSATLVILARLLASHSASDDLVSMSFQLSHVEVPLSPDCVHESSAHRRKLQSANADTEARRRVSKTSIKRIDASV